MKQIFIAYKVADAKYTLYHIGSMPVYWLSLFSQSMTLTSKSNSLWWQVKRSLSSKYNSLIFQRFLSLTQIYIKTVGHTEEEETMKQTTR